VPGHYHGFYSVVPGGFVRCNRFRFGNRSAHARPADFVKRSEDGKTGAKAFEDIRHAAVDACLHDEIMAMPGGYDAEISERGQNLSGGQRQRLALVRIFLKNPPILVLDDGTSALDTISERNVQRAIDAARADRTVILVAQSPFHLARCRSHSCFSLTGASSRSAPMPS